MIERRETRGLKFLLSKGIFLWIDRVVESNSLMKDSYVMINPQGQFYSGVTGRYLYSESILEVGVEKAMTRL